MEVLLVITGIFPNIFISTSLHPNNYYHLSFYTYIIYFFQLKFIFNQVHNTLQKTQYWQRVSNKDFCLNIHVESHFKQFKESGRKRARVIFEHYIGPKILPLEKFVKHVDAARRIL